MNIKRNLYKSKTLSDSTHPIYFSFSLNRKMHYLPVYKNDKRFRSTTQKWDSTSSLFKCNKKLNPEYDALNGILKNRENKLYQIIQKITDDQQPLTINLIRQHFYNIYEHSDVITYIDQMLLKSNYGEKTNLERVKKDLLDFNNNKSIAFADINYDFVKELIRYQQFNKRNNTTIGIRLRYLRKVLNSAIKSNVGCKSIYPFSNKYGATDVINITKYEREERKIAVNTDIIKVLKEGSSKRHENEIARRLFLTSYAARGMNFKDTALMTKDNLSITADSTYIRYRRNKTGALINFKVSPLLQEQLDWFESNTSLHNNHLFPIIENDITEEEYVYLQRKLKQYNYRLSKLADELNIDNEKVKLTSYASRHSFATTLYHNGVSINKISHCLSHQNVKTTEAYLKQFDEDKIADEIESFIG